MVLPELPPEIVRKIHWCVIKDRAAVCIQRHWHYLAAKIARVTRGLERVLLNVAKQPIAEATVDLFVYRDEPSHVHMLDDLGEPPTYPPHLLIFAEMVSELNELGGVAQTLPYLPGLENPLFVGSLICQPRICTFVIYRRFGETWSKRVGRTFTRRWRSEDVVTLRERKSRRERCE